MFCLLIQFFLPYYFTVYTINNGVFTVNIYLEMIVSDAIIQVEDCLQNTVVSDHICVFTSQQTVFPSSQVSARQTSDAWMCYRRQWFFCWLIIGAWDAAQLVSEIHSLSCYSATCVHLARAQCQPCRFEVSPQKRRSDLHAEAANVWDALDVSALLGCAWHVLNRLRLSKQ